MTTTDLYPDTYPPKAIHTGTEDGIAWCTAYHPNGIALNGYARLPQGHPWRELEVEFDRTPADVPGGITLHRGGWIGFDTYHAGDYWPGDPMFPYGPIDMGGPVTYWTQDMVVDAAKDLARQVAKAAK